jgi:hypothetical protein
LADRGKKTLYINSEREDLVKACLQHLAVP